MAGQPTALLIEAFGVPASVVVEDPALLAAAQATLPPGWRPLRSGDPAIRVALRGSGSDGYVVVLDDGPPAHAEDAAQALDLFDAKLRLAVAELAPAFAFIHAGVVVAGGRALLLPGRSFAGKTTLVAALLRAGATYYSDEYAVLDAAGLVHPYAKPLSIRPPGALRTVRDATVEVEPTTLGAEVGSDPVPVGLIASATFELDARWAPETRSPGETALALFGNAVAARRDPERVLACIRMAVGTRDGLEGRRGEADETAPLLLRRLAALG